MSHRKDVELKWVYIFITKNKHGYTYIWFYLSFRAKIGWLNIFKHPSDTQWPPLPSVIRCIVDFVAAGTLCKIMGS